MAEPTVHWANDLTPIAAADWSFDCAAHLLERAGSAARPRTLLASRVGARSLLMPAKNDQPPDLRYFQTGARLTGTVISQNNLSLFA